MIEAIIVSSPSGTRRGPALSKVRDLVGCDQVEIADVEDELEKVAAAELKDPDSPIEVLSQDIGENPSIQELTRRLPRDCVARLWRKALDSACSTLEAAEKAGKRHLILSLHLTYYRGYCYEFYSPVDHGHLLRKIKPSRVITLVDDVYDMYVRLAERGAIFDIRRLVQQEYARRKEAGEDISDRDGQYLQALGMVIRTLVMCLTWRSKEMLASELLAAQAGCLHRLLAVKHPITTGAQLICGESPGVDQAVECYLSHPIARPRRYRNREGKWPSVVRHLHQFVGTLLAATQGNTVALIMPTTIDELRVLTDADSLLMPVLGDRWPLLLNTPELLYSLPSDYASYAKYERDKIAVIFDPPITWDGKQRLSSSGDFLTSYSQLKERTRLEVSGMLHSLMHLVRLQLTNRDHALVRQCPGILLYRPLYEEFTWSGGVSAEVEHWKDLVKLKADPAAEEQERRRAMFLHAPAEAEKLEGKISNKQAGEAVRSKLLELSGRDPPEFQNLYQEIDYQQEGWLDQLLVKAYELLGDRSPVSPEFADKMKTIYRDALEDAVKDNIEEQRTSLQSHVAMRCGEPVRVKVFMHPTLAVLDELDETSESEFWLRLVGDHVLAFFLQ